MGAGFFGDFKKNVGDFHKDHNWAVIAEDRVLSEAISLGAVFVVDEALKRIDIKPLNETVAKVIKPHIALPDKIMNEWLLALETDSETAERQALDDDARAYHYARTFLNAGVTVATSIVSQTVAQRLLDHARGLPEPVVKRHEGDSFVGRLAHELIGNPYNKAATYDKIACWGSSLIFNSVLSKPNKDMQLGLKGMIQKLGVDEERASDMAKQTVIIGVPNVVGMLASISELTKAYGPAK